MLRKLGILVLAGLGLLMPEAMGAGGSLVRPDANWRVMRLTAPPPENWVEPGFDDRGWPEMPGGFTVGYTSYSQPVTALPGWDGQVPARGIALRRTIRVDDPEAVLSLVLRIEYEDGLIVWLNGKEVLRVGFPPGPVPPWNAPPAAHSAGEASVFDLGPGAAILRPGTNQVAMQVFDASVFSPTLFAWPELRANFTRGPILQNVSSNAASVVWRTPGAGEGRVELRPSAEGAGVAVRRAASGPGPGFESSVRFEGLEPGASYEYRVVLGGEGGRESATEWAAFRTLRSSGAVEFVVVGDTGTQTAGQLEMASALGAARPDLVLHTGDIVYPSYTVGRVDLRCLSVFEESLRVTPWFMTFGNHDIYQGDGPYLETFELPRNSVTGGEQFYSFDHGEVHFVSLFLPWWGMSRIGESDPDGARSAQYRWLTNDLAGTRKPWKVVFFHQPPRTSGPHYGDDYDLDGESDMARMQAELVPLLASLGVQLVFNGHDHVWERFAPTNGLHQVISGGGGAFLYQVVRRDSASAQFISRHHYSRVRADEARLTVDAVGSVGGVLDTFTLRRVPDSGASLVAGWRERLTAGAGVPDVDGNVPGEEFGIAGEGVAGVSVGSANLGRIVAAADTDGLHLGLRDLMLWPGQTLALFVGTESGPGVASLAGAGRSRNHALGRLRLRFESSRASVVCLLGDERADGNRPDFVRPGTTLALGQGVYRLDEGLSPVRGVRVRQFNRSPEQAPVAEEQNADFAVVTIPWGAVPGLVPGADARVSAVVLRPSASAAVAGEAAETVTIDPGYLARARRRDPIDDTVVLEPIPVRIGEAAGGGEDGDADADGLSNGDELARGTDPRNPDTDGDGMPDGWEVRVGLNPKGAGAEDGADGDPDRDGYINAEEWESGTDPRDATSTLRAGATTAGGVLRVSWRATIGRSYVVETSGRIPATFEPVSSVEFPRRAVRTNEVVEVPIGIGPAWFRGRGLR